MAGFKHLAAKPLLYIESGMCCVVYDPKFMFHWQHANSICVHYMEPVPVIHYFYSAVNHLCAAVATGNLGFKGTTVP